MHLLHLTVQTHLNKVCYPRQKKKEFTLSNHLGEGRETMPDGLYCELLQELAAPPMIVEHLRYWQSGCAV